ncbi:DUF397 domain-containing protein [Nocardia sp. SYP-A9097]|uniref:DUF397 domain-containing protein n=1 Tax=Nocardia sp. SYP-A9097 TaxID=2663237 RepID=UPI00132BAF02|nr:DUF397 domain-containing protein [Nocardia sp. SYP-A9097]MRH87991.1 DUF397 domain-containing protein [Nocardia sp. SYP-A9097]
MGNELCGVTWFKSTYSQAQGECVEVAHLESGRVGVRDSKNPSGPALVFPQGAWDAFLAGIMSGEF